MEDPAPKRRKTSPSTSSPAEGSNAAGSSDGSVRRSTRQRKPQRPSFASPTKSSLSRANPDVLERRNAARAQSRSAAPSASRPGSAGSHGDEDSMITAQLEGASETNRLESGDDYAQPPKSGEAAHPRSQSPVRRATGGMAARPRRTPQKPPRPLPPPSQEEEVLLNPFKGRVLRRSPPRGVLPQVVPEEPELPPTPTEKGISSPAEMQTSPLGIHNTPSKRARRSRALAEKIRSSPLKQPPMRPPGLEGLGVGGGKENFHPSKLRRISGKGSQVNSNDKTGKRRRKSHPARSAKEFDPLADKKAVRDSLLAEVKQLEADIALASRENERVRQFHLSQSSETAAQHANPTELLDLLRRNALAPEKEPTPSQSQNWLDAALNPISFLPFGKPISTLHTLELLSSSSPLDEDANKESPPPISHHPVSMTAAEELPYLQVFTPLAFTSEVSLLPQSDIDQSSPLMQRHVITASSTPAGLFAAKIEMVANTKTLSVTELRVPKLDPNATSELGPFIEQIADGKGGSSALRRNVSVIAWAMSEWTRLASRRARFWCKLERELRDRESILRCVKDLRKGVGKRKRPGRPARGVEDEDEEDDDNAEKSDGDEKLADVLLHMGRSSLDLDLGEDDRLSLKVQWRIEFDWTGEGQSKIGILVGTPAKWHGHDKQGSLMGIPKMFDDLLRNGKDPMIAVKTIVALLVGEGRK